MSDKPINVKLTSGQQAAIGFAYLHPRLAAKIVIWKYIFGWIFAIITIPIIFHYAILSDKHDVEQMHKQQRIERHIQQRKADAAKAEHDRIENLPMSPTIEEDSKLLQSDKYQDWKKN